MGDHFSYSRSLPDRTQTARVFCQNSKAMSAKSKIVPAPPRAVRNVKTVPIDAIHIDPGNVRVHPSKNKATIRASLARFGAGRSIVLDGNNVVRAGNGTVEQARDAGYTEVLVVEPGPNQIVAVKRPDWSDSVGTAYSIADNTSTDQSEDDQTRLAATLEALRNDGFDLAAMGHSSEGLDELLKTLADEKLANPDTPPAEDPGPQIDRADELQKKWQTALGQLWIIPSKTAQGDHRLLCGDSTKAEDVARVMGGEKAALMLTDPPYNVDLDYEGYDDKDEEAYFKLVSGFLSIAKNVSDLWILTAGNKQNNYWFEKHKPTSFLVWFDKTKQSPHAAAHLSKSELILIFGKVLERYAWDTFEIEGLRGDGLRELHRCPKPVELYRALLEPQVQPRATIYDPFLGSGTTIVAAEQTGRLCRGIEIAPKYVAVALERLAGMGLEPRQS
jgi:DNA modification methylase